ncbi:MAG: hypothetical protein QFX35_03560 [Candidatus Verstraetearchaeota archaeon]|nr:hypothetical protein [Candidatus Verstraetearchaeota archaeon]
MPGKVRLFSRGEVPIIAVAMLVAISFVTTGIFSSEVMKVFSSPAPEDISIQEIRLTKHYGYVDLKLTVRSNTERPLSLKVSVIGEENREIPIAQKIQLAPSSSATVRLSGTYGRNFFVGKSYVVKVLGDLDLSYLVECKGVEISNNKIVILAIEGIGAISKGKGIDDSSAVIAGVEDTAEKLGVPYEKVTTMSRWLQIMSGSERGIIVINPYGSVIPAPTSALSNPEAYIRGLGTLVNNRGWTWVHTGGFPFGALSDGITLCSYPSGGNKESGDNAGLEAFFNKDHVVTPTSNPPQLLDEEFLTDTDGNSLTYFITVTGMTGLLPSTLRFDCSINLPPSDVPQTKHVFYYKKGEPNQTGARSFIMGSGYFVFWGGPQSYSEYNTGCVSLMIALYTNVR